MFVLPWKSSWKELAKVGLLWREMQMWWGVRTLFHDFMQTDRQTDLVKQKEAALNEKEIRHLSWMRLRFVSFLNQKWGSWAVKSGHQVVQSAVWLSTSKVTCTALKNLSIPKWHLKSLPFCVSNVCYFLWNLSLAAGMARCSMIWPNCNSLTSSSYSSLRLSEGLNTYHLFITWINHVLSQAGACSLFPMECSMFPIFIGLLLPILWFQCHLHEEVFPYLNCLHLLSRIMNNL